MARRGNYRGGSTIINLRKERIRDAKNKREAKLRRKLGPNLRNLPMWKIKVALRKPGWEASVPGLRILIKDGKPTEGFLVSNYLSDETTTNFSTNDDD